MSIQIIKKVLTLPSLVRSLSKDKYYERVDIASLTTKAGKQFPEKQIALSRLLAYAKFINKSADPIKTRLRNAEREKVRKKQPVLMIKATKKSQLGILANIVSCGTFLLAIAFIIKRFARSEAR